MTDLLNKEWRMRMITVYGMPSCPEFKKVREKGLIGIPCFVREDGSITLKPEEVGLKGE